VAKETPRARRRLFPAATGTILILWTAFMLSPSFLSEMHEIGALEDPISKGPTFARTLTLTPHDPIQIDGNDGFSGPNASTGITRGSGTESDPYIIEDWEIGPFASTGIEIKFVDVHFVIQNCYIHDALASYKWAIYMYQCSNGTIRNNTCSNSYYGIYLESSSNNSLAGNDCSDCSIFLYYSNMNSLFNNTDWLFLQYSHGNSLVGNTGSIYIQHSDGNEVTHNSCVDGVNPLRLDHADNNYVAENQYVGSDGGIQIRWSRDNSLVNNTCSLDDGCGVFLEECFNITLRGNEMVGCGINVNGFETAHYSSHAIDTTNSVNGRPVFYFRDQAGLTVPSGAGQVLLANCTDMRIEGQNISHTSVCIGIAFCTGVTVTDNNCTGSQTGIMMAYSQTNNLARNTCADLMDGIRLEYADHNDLTNNTCSSCVVGLYIMNSEENTVTGSGCSSNWVYGIYLGGSDANVLVGNNCSSNGFLGVYLASSDFNAVSGSNCSWNGLFGLEFQDSSSNSIQNNWIEGNGGYGIRLWSGSNNTVWDNRFVDNNGATEVFDLLHIQAMDNGIGNWWNTTDGHGNYWSDWRGPDLSPIDGVVDCPYAINGSAAAWDFYPIAEYPGTDVPEPSPVILVVLMLALILAVLRRRA